MRLSGATGIEGPFAAPDEAARSLDTDHIAFVLLDQRTASTPLTDFVATLPLTRIEADDRRILYVVTSTTARRETAADRANAR